MASALSEYEQGRNSLTRRFRSSHTLAASRISVLLAADNRRSLLTLIPLSRRRDHVDSPTIPKDIIASDREPDGFHSVRLDAESEWAN